MGGIVSPETWQTTRVAFKETGEQFAELVLSSPPQAKVTAHWTVADTAAHLLVVAMLCRSLVERDQVPEMFPTLHDQIRSTTVDTIADLNVAMMGRLTERDPRVLMAEMRTAIDDVLRAAAEPDRPCPWLGQAQVPVAGLLAHMVNEMLIHGYDIARATRVPWRIPPPYAALFVDVFLCGMLHYDYGRLLDPEMPLPDRRIAVQFRSEYSTLRTLVLRDNRVTLDDTHRDVDVRVRFDPPTLNLMMFHRIPKARALLSRKVVVGGPRPWLLPAFLRKMRMPN